MQPRERVRIPVMVQADDPMSAAGATALIREQPGLELLPGDALAGDDPAGDGAEEAGEPVPRVAVLVTEEVDEPAIAHCRRLGRRSDLRLVLIVSRMREAELMRVIECGVSNVLWRREVTSEQLTAAVLGALRGDGNIPPDLLGRLLTQVGRLQRSILQPQGLGYGGVSEREAEVLKLISDGLDTGEIATKLSYSERTIKNILHSLMGRLHLRNRAHAVAYALREGFI